MRGKLDTDQRGVFARTYDDPAIANAGDGTDVGAFELQPGGPTPTPTPTPTPDPSPSPTSTPSGQSGAKAPHSKEGSTAIDTTA